MTVPHPGGADTHQRFRLSPHWAALGVVYGDIAPVLFSMKEAAKEAAHGGPSSPEAILGGWCR